MYPASFGLYDTELYHTERGAVPTLCPYREEGTSFVRGTSAQKPYSSALGVPHRIKLLTYQKRAGIIRVRFSPSGELHAYIRTSAERRWKPQSIYAPSDLLELCARTTIPCSADVEPLSL